MSDKLAEALYRFLERMEQFRASDAEGYWELIEIAGDLEEVVREEMGIGDPADDVWQNESEKVLLGARR